jgi:predicted Zn-dependent protease
MAILTVSLSFAQSSPDQSDQTSQDQSKDKNNSKDAKDSKDDESFYHHTGINDVNAIGSRNVGCNRGLGNWYSLDSQVKMGQEFARQVEASGHLITDPVVNEYVNRLGQNLARNSDTRLPFTIKILDIEEPNAFALPGGFMFVHAGTIILADDESELAGVMAHEIGHVAACHTAREQTRGTLASIAMIPLIMVGGPLISLGTQEVAGLAVPATFMKFSRSFEAQADYLGIQYAYKAGYDPVGMINFFEKLEAEMDKRKWGAMMKIYGDHPQTPDRISKSQHEIATILPPRDQYIVDTSEFEQVKKRLALIMKHRNVNNNKNDDNPDLRRTVDDKNPQQQDDDRPVIKRNPGN